MLRNVLRATLVMALMLGICNLGTAQYGGGGGMGGGMPGSPMHRSYGTSKAAVIGAIAGGAAAGAGFLLWKRHNRVEAAQPRQAARLLGGWRRQARQ